MAFDIVPWDPSPVIAVLTVPIADYVFFRNKLQPLSVDEDCPVTARIGYQDSPINSEFSSRKLSLGWYDDVNATSKTLLQNIVREDFGHEEPPAVHVFIDMSNALIGFYNAIEKSQEFSDATGLSRPGMSFNNLALILERDRPVLKRVLCGSDRLAFTNDAEFLGYEINILDRVQRSIQSSSRKSLSPNQQFRKKAEIKIGARRWVEQGVDEVLQFKMLESLLDCTPGTMVLVSGDASVSDYSSGFMTVVVRALKLGWHVEIVSFRHQMSWFYQCADFRNTWATQLRLIYLDKYTNYLVDYENDVKVW